MKKTVYLVKTKLPKDKRPNASSGSWLSSYRGYVPLQNAYFYDSKEDAICDTRIDYKDVIVEATLELTIK